VDVYGEMFDEVWGTVSDLLEKTTDLTRLDEEALDVLTDEAMMHAFRYLAGPPISVDDLVTLIDAPSISGVALRNDPELVSRIVGVVRDGLDRRRFPWLAEDRLPSEAEKQTAVTATAALAAMRRVETWRRNQGKASQEARVRQALLAVGFRQVTLPSSAAPTLAQAPEPGEFSVEATLGGRKADFIVGLWDHRIMPIECKVSNSSVNSIKRLNNDAAVKAAGWLTDLGHLQIVPAAVLSGVYNLEHLEDAQRRGLSIYWAHRLDDLTNWIESTR
jgi:hypothetical protein